MLRRRGIAQRRKLSVQPTEPADDMRSAVGGGEPHPLNARLLPVSGDSGISLTDGYVRPSGDFGY
jgi:hypothetical protein